MAEKQVTERRRYLAYLLRLWQESGSGQIGPPLWRASLERPQGDERRGFGSLADLFTFLEEQTGSTPPGCDESVPDER